jgi:hypothetical protein
MESINIRQGTEASDASEDSADQDHGRTELESKESQDQVLSAKSSSEPIIVDNLLSSILPNTVVDFSSTSAAAQELVSCNATPVQLQSGQTSLVEHATVGVSINESNLSDGLESHLPLAGKVEERKYFSRSRISRRFF